jgi:hypothetical protein
MTSITVIPDGALAPIRNLELVLRQRLVEIPGSRL